MNLRAASLLASIAACAGCFHPVDELPDDWLDAGRDAGRDAGVDGGVDGGACATACCQCDFGPPRPCPPSTDPCARVPFLAVDRVASVSGPDAGPVRVVLARGVSYQLDLDQPVKQVYRQMLEHQHAANRPTALEIDCQANRVTRVYSPYEPSPVMRLTSFDGGLVLSLATSAALHPVLRSNACFDRLASALWAAQDAGTMVLVTDHQPRGMDVIDVRKPF